MGSKLVLLFVVYLQVLLSIFTCLLNYFWVKLHIMELLTILLLESKDLSASCLKLLQVKEFSYIYCLCNHASLF